MDTFDADRKSLSPNLAPSRRQMMQASLATGFALAAQPVSAQTVITTDSTGLTAGEIEIPAADRALPAYRAMPATGGPFPVVLVVQEIFGVHEHIKDVCRRLAKQGYMAIAVEMYARQGDVSKLSDIKQIFEIVSKVPDAQVMADLDSAVTYAAKSGKGDVSKLAITGFCWGGRVTWLYAARNPGVKAAVAWYGKIESTTDDLHPKNPIDIAAQLEAPVLGLYGAADQGIPVSGIQAMQIACEKAGKTCEFMVYPDTPHAFHADYRPSYREGPAKDGWARMLAWMKKHGAA
jgi:carboxymethylenebutenolidase